MRNGNLSRCPDCGGLLGIPPGFGTALKPAAEFWTVARKPLIGTVAANVQRFGTGAINVDGCRIVSSGQSRPSSQAKGVAGRWPPNVVLSPEAAAELDCQSGDTRSGDHPGGGSGGIWTESHDGVPVSPGYGDTGGASRFFYVAKASRAERNAGLDDLARRTTDDGRQIPIDNPFLRGETLRQNTHPTVKPIDLMRWLVRLVTPPGGTVLDPFTGSGTTGIACVLEDFDFIGIEREAEYVEIARARIDYWAKQPKQLELAA